jgi:hypothetical protein
MQNEGTNGSRDKVSNKVDIEGGASPKSHCEKRCPCVPKELMFPISSRRSAKAKSLDGFTSQAGSKKHISCAGRSSDFTMAAAEASE